MGMFDYLYCEYPLPEEFERFQNNKFQTKSLECCLHELKLTKEGELRINRFFMPSVYEGVKAWEDFCDKYGERHSGYADTWEPFTEYEPEDIWFYNYVPSTKEWIEFKAVFENRRVIRIELITHHGGEE